MVEGEPHYGRVSHVAVPRCGERDDTFWDEFSHERYDIILMFQLPYLPVALFYSESKRAQVLVGRLGDSEPREQLAWPIKKSLRYLTKHKAVQASSQRQPFTSLFCIKKLAICLHCTIFDNLYHHVKSRGVLIEWSWHRHTSTTQLVSYWHKTFCKIAAPKAVPK